MPDLVKYAHDEWTATSKKAGGDYPVPICSLSGTEKEVCEDIARRQQLGIKKYGTTVQDNPLALEEWLQHAYEETIDKAIYLKRAIQEIKENV